MLLLIAQPHKEEAQSALHTGIGLKSITEAGLRNQNRGAACSTKTLGTRHSLGFPTEAPLLLSPPVHPLKIIPQGLSVPKRGISSPCNNTKIFFGYVATE